MKLSKKYCAIAFCAPLCAIALNSCGLEEPFGKGEGELHIRMQLNSEVTRAETDATDLASTVKLYLSQGDNLYYKFEGLDNVPSAIPFKSGIYTAEAYAGVKSPASFTDKYYEGSTNFEITTGVTNVVLECKIANIVAAVNYETINPEVLKNYTITVGHSKGSLLFDETYAETETRGYYTMPEGETALTYTVEGENADGQHFTKSGTIENVQPAHLYSLNVRCNPDYAQEGGAFIEIEVDDSEMLIESEVVLTAAPEIAGLGFDISKQESGAKGGFSDRMIRVRSFGELKSLRITGLDNWIHSSEIDNTCDFMTATTTVVNKLAEYGFSFRSAADANNSSLQRTVITLSADLLNSLPVSEEQYLLEIEATDKTGKKATATYRLANTAGAIVIDDPVVSIPIDQNNDLLAVGATTATLNGTIASADAINPGIKFRESGTDNWQFVGVANAASKAKRTRAAQNFTVKLSNLKPGTRYEYKAVADGFESSDSYFFTTEGKFIIPNYSMEEWDSYSAKTMLGTRTVWFPGTGERTFWDSGNEGGATANKILTNKSTDMLHSGTYSARLASDKAMGILAAGNLFAGKYEETVGTNGVLTFGREYNGSHPYALRLWANYRPGKVDIRGQESNIEVVKGGTDQAQIYVALTTSPVQVKTDPNDRVLFNPDGDYIVAYGEITWKGNFGADGQLEKVEIPLTYKAKAKTVKPLYLVITCSAAKFGDYFSGSSSSVMYVDDFELVYE
ncbi:MAG: DUF4493 domain-containing protein [Prevotella sp.]|nr:DUF4493 domain-containing protein [Bacteroides sp.]MCM1366718.1 DUF4493 domain-containing protein [Prevotella sp.]MCM1437268.1 DUF4493 domain-containing protein [Prevotella sp.]